MLLTPRWNVCAQHGGHWPGALIIHLMAWHLLRAYCRPGMRQALYTVSLHHHNRVSWLLLSPSYRPGDKSREVARPLTLPDVRSLSFLPLGRDREMMTCSLHFRSWPLHRPVLCKVGIGILVTHSKPKNGTSSQGHKARRQHLAHHLPFRKHRGSGIELTACFEKRRHFSGSYPGQPALFLEFGEGPQEGQARRPQLRSGTHGPLPMGWQHRMLL